MRPRASQVVMIMLVGTATLATGQAVNAPGQGSFELDVETVEAEGKGCGMDYLDIQVGDVIESALVINAVPDTDCRAGSSSCMYKYNWKCSDLDSEEDKPKEQQAVGTVADDGKSARVVVPQYKYPSFDGSMQVLEEYYTVTDGSIEGYERWSWTSADGTRHCSGRDKITGVPGEGYCDQDVFTDPYDEIPSGPVPEGIWQLSAETMTLKGRDCAGMEYKIGDTTKSSLIINRGYDEDGRRSDSMFEILYKCSSDAGLVDWVDDGKLTRHAGGNMSLEVRRTPMGEMEDADQGDEQDGRAQEDDGDYEVYSMVFCYDASAAQSYTICDGHSSWEYKSGGKTCKGKDKLVGEWGGCTEEMKTIDDVEPEIDADEVDEDWGQDVEQDDAQGGFGKLSQEFGLEEEAKDHVDEAEAQRLNQGGTEQGKNTESGLDALSSQAGAVGPVGGAPGRGQAPISPGQEFGEEMSPEGYPIRDYQAPRTSYLAMLLVGLPLGTLVAGLAFIAMRRCQARAHGPGGEYARVAVRGDGDL